MKVLINMGFLATFSSCYIFLGPTPVKTTAAFSDPGRVPFFWSRLPATWSRSRQSTRRCPGRQKMAPKMSVNRPSPDFVVDICRIIILI